MNTVKTKCMAIGPIKPLDLYLNDQKIEQVIQYTRMGNILKSLHNSNAEILPGTKSYLCDQERNAIFGMMHKIRHIAHYHRK